MDADIDDPDLVAAALRGDPPALAAIYDRYADRVHDMCLHMLSDHDEAADVCGEVFLVAFARLGQLRDPSRLRSWLFAIARHEVYRRSRRRSRTRLVEDVGQMDRLMAEQGIGAAGPGADADVDADVDAELLVGVLRDAAAGLDERDRMVMELQLQGLDGEELAGALGTSVATGYQHVHRMKERLERSVGAVLVARHGRDDCEDLDRLLAGWDGTFSVLWRKRVARHVDGCEVCERRRTAVPAALFGTAAVLPMVPASALSAAPGSVRDRVLADARVAASQGGRGWRSDGFPADGVLSDGRSRRSIAALVAVVALVLVALGGFLLARDDVTEIATGDTSSTTSAPTTTTTSAPDGDATTTVVPSPPPAPGSSVPVPPPPSAPAPGASGPSAPPAAPDPATPLPDTTSVEPGPEVDLTIVPDDLYHPFAGVGPCGATTDLVAVAATSATRVQLWWRDAGGADGMVEMVAVAGEWRASLEVPDEVAGPVTLVAVATDAAGRTGTSRTATVPVRACPTPG